MPRPLHDRARLRRGRLRSGPGRGPSACTPSAARPRVPDRSRRRRIVPSSMPVKSSPGGSRVLLNGRWSDSLFRLVRQPVLGRIPLVTYIDRIEAGNPKSDSPLHESPGIPAHRPHTRRDPFGCDLVGIAARSVGRACTPVGRHAPGQDPPIRVPHACQRRQNRVG